MPRLSVSTLLRTALATVLLVTPTFAQSASTGATADEVMAQLKSEAATQHKNILLMFGASWCGNCHLFDRFLADPTIHPLMDKTFVFADLASGEQKNDKRHANIPGGPELQTSLGGGKAGFPYLVMLDASGAPLANSIAPKTGNIGYPDSAQEIDWFMEMLKKAAPSLSADEMKTVKKWLRAHSTKP